MEKSGVLMLAPVYKLFFGQNKEWIQSLELTEDQISITYKTYKTNKAADLQEIINQKLAPGTIIIL